MEATTLREVHQPGWNGDTRATDFALRVLEEIDYGLIFLSPSGELQHANHLARHELAKARFLRVEDSKVVGCCAAQTEALMRGVRWAAQGRRQMLNLQDGADTLCIACVPLVHAFEDRAPSVLVMLARQSGTQNLAITFFSRMHSLTPAEESVLKALCDGREVQEIAAANGVSAHTVRTQVRSVRDKTGMGSMRHLVQHVAALPPVVPMSLCAPVRTC
jgi:DNA-binding CsgD family transcriptional regulator